MKVLFVGLGEVGWALHEIFVKSKKFDVYGIDINPEMMKRANSKEPVGEMDIIHICIQDFPQNHEKFVQIILNYTLKYFPQLIIINSTVIPHTTEEIASKITSKVVHSPCWGTHISHEYMVLEQLRWWKLIGPTSENAGKMAYTHFLEAGFKPKLLKKSIDSEIAKIAETTYGGWMITYFNELERLCKREGADYLSVAGNLGDVHLINKYYPYWFPDVIRGHCIMQNLDLLEKIHPRSLWVEVIKDSNKRREEEVKYKDTQQLIEAAKRKYCEIRKAMGEPDVKKD